MVDGGVREAVALLTANLNRQHIHLSSPIVAIQSDPQDPRFATMQYLHDAQTQEITSFRHIILATETVRAVPLLTSYLRSLPSNKLDHIIAIQDQIQCLKAFQYRPSTMESKTALASLFVSETRKWWQCPYQDTGSQRRRQSRNLDMWVVRTFRYTSIGGLCS